MKHSIQIGIVLISLLITSCSKPKNTKAMNSPETILNAQIEKNKSPGLQYYFFNMDSILYSYHGGYANLNTKQKVTDQHSFNAYSTTKTFTALAVLQLAEKGLCNIENPIAEYLPEFPYPKSITIKQLLTHSAGIPNPLPLKWVHTSDEHNSFNSNNFFNNVFIEHNEVKSHPNDKFAYSNLGYVLLGQLIEQLSGLSYEQYIIQHIVAPLGIESSNLNFAFDDKEQQATGYQKKISFMNLMLSFLFDKTKYVDTKKGKWISFIEFHVNGTAHGGLKGTGHSFVRYIQTLLKPNNELISEESKQLLFTENSLNNGKPSGMCLAWFRGELNGNTYYAHAGGGCGYYCEIRIYPDLGKGSVIMFNRTGMSDERFLDDTDKCFIASR